MTNMRAAMQLKETSPGRRSLSIATLIIGLICLLVPLVATGADDSGGAANFGWIPRRATVKGAPAKVRAGLERLDRVIVKFREGTMVRMRNGRLASLDRAVRTDGLERWMGRHPDVRVTRHFSRSETELDQAKQAGERETGWELADLNLYYVFELPTSDRTPSAVEALIAELRGLPLVETAFDEPVAQPAVVEMRTNPIRPRERPPFLPTPDYSAQQGYLYASPSGINAQAVWGFPGGRGATVKIIDIEGGWLWTHEDLRTPFFTGGTQIDDQGWRNHGTAVMGEMVGRPNGFGITGIASDLQVGGNSIGSMGVADAIDLAAANESAGDLFLIELHAPGPNANGSGQYGYVPMEYWQDNFDAIQTAVANGRICIEAGGNGEQNLDDAVYQNLFNRTFRNSGAILVGAGTPTGLDAEWFTNYGTRIDLNGWGESVATTGYGDLQGGAESQWYTSGFSGTSSASPIVSGAVASLQGMSKAMWGIALNGPLAAEILFNSGTPWVGTKRIGNRPNLVGARMVLQQGIGTIGGTVRDAVTGQPIANAHVLLVEKSILLLTDASGVYHVPVMIGNYTLQVSDFFHTGGQQSTSVGPGQSVTLDFNLNPAPNGYLAGAVLASTGAPLAGAIVRVLNTPIPSTVSDPAGLYSLTGIPVGGIYQAVYGLVPGHGAAWKAFSIAQGRATIINPILPDAQTFEANNGGYTGDALWQWGTPSDGPGGSFSGTKCWGTDLVANYPDNTTAYLTSPVFDFHTATTLSLSFSHYYDTESGFDGGNVQVRVGTSWVTLTPKGGYSMDNLSGLGGESGWCGSSGGWQPAVLDLTPYIGSSVQIRFHFGSDESVNYAGWYIDDVAFDVGAIPADVAEGPSARGAILMPARPNPFRDATEIGFRLPAVAGAVRLLVVDPAGRIVRDLYDGPAAASGVSRRWDGNDGSGRSLPAGVYFAILNVDGKTVGRRTLIRLH
jgi:serine protease